MKIPATLCYLQKDDKILMMHRIKKENDIHKDKWNGLGGKFEAGESPEECVIREIKEESGLELINPDLKGIITFPLFDKKNDWLVFVFSATKWNGNLSVSTEGELAWISLEKLFSLPMWEGDYIFLPWVLNDKFFSAKFRYKNG